MRVVLIGGAGSGKTWLASRLALELKLPHLEADLLYWEGKQEVPLDTFREKVKVHTTHADWIFEGHIGKIADVVLPLSDKIILMDTPPLQGLLRGLRRDLKKWQWKRIFFNLRHHEKMRERRLILIQDLRKKRPQDILTWKAGQSLAPLLEELTTSFVLADETLQERRLK